MKHLKTFEKYSEKYHDPKVDLEYVKSLSDEDIKNIYKELDFGGHDEYQEESSIGAITELRDEMSKYKAGDKITLYRVLKLKDLAKLDKNNLGEHYVLSLDVVNSFFLRDIGIDDEDNLYSIEIETNISDINLQRTIITRAEYPHEQEISLLTDDNVEIIDIKKFEPSH